MTLANVLLMTVSEIFGNANFKHYAGGTGHQGHLAGGFVGYVGVMYFLIKSFSGASMLWVGAMWEGMITILGSAYAFFILGERFDSWIQYAGLLLGLVAMCMVHVGGAHRNH